MRARVGEVICSEAIVRSTVRPGRMRAAGRRCTKARGSAMAAWGKCGGRRRLWS